MSPSSYQPLSLEDILQRLSIHPTDPSLLDLLASQTKRSPPSFTSLSSLFSFPAIDSIHQQIKELYTRKDNLLALYLKILRDSLRDTPLSIFFPFLEVHRKYVFHTSTEFEQHLFYADIPLKLPHANHLLYRYISFHLSDVYPTIKDNSIESISDSFINFFIKDIKLSDTNSISDPIYPVLILESINLPSENFTLPLPVLLFNFSISLHNSAIHLHPI